MFTNELGVNLSSYMVYNNFKQVVASIGYSAVRFYDMRRSYITLKDKANKNINWLSTQIRVPKAQKDHLFEFFEKQFH